MEPRKQSPLLKLTGLLLMLALVLGGVILFLNYR